MKNPNLINDDRFWNEVAEIVESITALAEIKKAGILPMDVVAEKATDIFYRILDLKINYCKSRRRIFLEHQSQILLDKYNKEIIFMQPQHNKLRPIF